MTADSPQGGGGRAGRRHDARSVALEVLERVERDNAYANLALDAALRRSELSPADRALCTELVYGTVRWRARLDYSLQTLAPRGLRVDAKCLIVLRLAAYQLLFLRVPARAVVHSAVETIKRLRGAQLAGFVNALLRRFAADPQGIALPDPAVDPIAALAVRESHPEWAVREVVARFGAAAAAEVLAAQNKPAPLTLRVNRQRADRESVIAELKAAFPDADVAPGRFAPSAIVARGVPDISAQPAFASGRLTVQDEAAQLMSHLLCGDGSDAPPRILDACAGVGGKSTHLAELCGQAHEIHAADASEGRLALLGETARRLGLTTIRPILADLTLPASATATTSLLPAYDAILLDAPCTGLGVARRRPDARWRRSEADVVKMAALQKQLLDNLLVRLAPGGVLLYSVCTYTLAEGPLLIDACLAADPSLTLERPAFAGLDPFLDAAGRFTSLPSRHGTDGFFAARLRRRR